MPSPPRSGRDAESSMNPSVSVAVDLVAAARIWGGQGFFYSRKTNAFFLFSVVLNCVAPLGMVSNEVPKSVAQFHWRVRHRRSARRQRVWAPQSQSENECHSRSLKPLPCALVHWAKAIVWPAF